MKYTDTKKFDKFKASWDAGTSSLYAIWRELSQRAIFNYVHEEEALHPHTLLINHILRRTEDKIEHESWIATFTCQSGFKHLSVTISVSRSWHLTELHKLVARNNPEQLFNILTSNKNAFIYYWTEEVFKISNHNRIIKEMNERRAERRKASGTSPTTTQRLSNLFARLSQYTPSKENLKDD